MGKVAAEQCPESVEMDAGARVGACYIIRHGLLDATAASSCHLSLATCEVRPPFRVRVRHSAPSSPVVTPEPNLRDARNFSPAQANAGTRRYGQYAAPALLRGGCC